MPIYIVYEPIIDLKKNKTVCYFYQQILWDLEWELKNSERKKNICIMQEPDNVTIAITIS